jgi:hypothetical protein
MQGPLLEAKIIGLLATKDKRERLLFLASKPARRDDLVDALLHDTRSLDRSLMVALGTGGSAADVAAVAARLGAREDARAHCISAIASLDGAELALGDALRACVSRARDTIVFCVATERAYYENHEGERFVLAARGR